MHWYGFDDQGNPVLPDEEPAQHLLTASRPINPYLDHEVTTEAFARIFQCPADDGVTIPGAAKYGLDTDPWGSLGNPAAHDDHSVFAKLGTSYQANQDMYSLDGKGHGDYRPNYGPRDVHVSFSDFVIVGDAGAMSIAETGLYKDVEIQGWWHGFARGQLAFLDGSARHETVVGDTLGYTFFRTP